MEFIEVSAKNVDEAITKACIDLGIPSDRLEYQVVSEGSSGFLGFGSKPAVIKAREKEMAAEEPAKEAAPETKQEKKAEKKVEPKKEISENQPAAEKEEAGSEKTERKRRENHRRDDRRRDGARREDAALEEPVKAPVIEKEPVIIEKTEEEIAAMKATAQEFLDSVFKAMELPVTIKMEYVKEGASLDIDFEGEDMGVLIGKRGQTLDSLQYLTSLVVNKEQKEYIRVKLDTEDYRKRRKETLENLARNIAYKVRRTRKPVSLEPMNPYERRIIHSALQSNHYVETYSEGNEPYRHIVVTLKK